MAFNVDAHLLEFGGDFAAKILQCIERRQRHVTFFISNVKTLIAIAILPLVFQMASGLSSEKPAA